MNKQYENYFLIYFISLFDFFVSVNHLKLDKTFDNQLELDHRVHDFDWLLALLPMHMQPPFQ